MGRQVNHNQKYMVSFALAAMILRLEVSLAIFLVGNYPIGFNDIGDAIPITAYFGVTACLGGKVVTAARSLLTIGIHN